MSLHALVTNLGILIGMMQLGNQIPWEQPIALWGARGLYVTVNILVLGVYYYMYTQILRENDNTKLTYPAPPPLGSAEKPKDVDTSVKEYDLERVKEGARNALLGVVFLAVMHLYLKNNTPLLVQSVMPLKTLYTAPLTKIHMLGQKAEGELKRPFKTEAGMFGQMASPEVKTDKKTK